MKQYKFELVILEGSDEFWESNPSYDAVRDMIENTFVDAGVDFESVRIIQYIEEFNE